VIGDDDICGGSREQEMEHEEIAFDVYKVSGLPGTHERSITQSLTERTQGRGQGSRL
jgi:hypothetical protein